MFAWIGRTVTRIWWLIVLLWAGGLAVAMVSRPEWSEVSTDGELRHLPDYLPTRAGGKLYTAAFPEDITDSSIVLVVHRVDEQLTQQDEHFTLAELVPALRKIADQYGGVLEEQQSLAELAETLLQRLNERVESWEETTTSEAVAEQPRASRAAARARVHRQQATSGDNESLAVQVVSIASVGDFLIGPMLRSADGQAMLVSMNLTSGFLTTENTAIAERVRQVVQRLQESPQKPAGLQLDVTGSTMMGVDTIEAVTQSTEAVRQWATWLALAMLLVVYRAPVSAVLPLVTMYVAVEISIALLAWAAYLGWIEVFDGLMLYVSVIVYGAGVDYSLFLVSRHREELLEGASVKEAARIAIASTGTAVAASAGTEILGIGLLGFAEFGKFQQAGMGIALGLAVLLVASLTLTPAMLCGCGQWAYWPVSLKKKQARGQAARHRRSATAEEIAESDWVTRMWWWLAQRQARHPLRIWVGTLAVLAPLAVYGAVNIDEQTYDLSSSLPPDTASIKGTDVLAEHFSQGATGPIRLVLRDETTSFSSLEGMDHLIALSDGLQQRADELQIASVRSVVDPLGTSARARQLINTLAGLAPQLSFLQHGELVLGTSPQMSEVEAILQELLRTAAARYYVSSTPPYADHVTWLSITPAHDPYSAESLEDLDQLEQTLVEIMPPELADAEFYLLGGTASLRDVRDVARRDFRLMAWLIPLGVLLVLIVLLRKIIIPVYLILTVLFSFLVTIGVTHAVFGWLQPADFTGLQWTVPVLLFVLLVAVGEDYSVLLVSRTDEEQQEHGRRRGISEALVRTGGLISGAGLIMAGTFSALALGGTLRGMHQLGFALTLGMLLDTFVVRPLLVPSFQHLLVRWSRRAAEKPDNP